MEGQAATASVRYVIEKGVPLREAYPLATMQPGDSFAVPRRESMRLTTAVGKYKKANPEQQWVTRSADGGRARRVWRLA